MHEGLLARGTYCPAARPVLFEKSICTTQLAERRQTLCTHCIDPKMAHAASNTRSQRCADHHLCRLCVRSNTVQSVAQTAQKDQTMECLPMVRMIRRLDQIREPTAQVSECGGAAPIWKVPVFLWRKFQVGCDARGYTKKSVDTTIGHFILTFPPPLLLTIPLIPDATVLDRFCQ